MKFRKVFIFSIALLLAGVFTARTEGKSIMGFLNGLFSKNSPKESENLITSIEETQPTYQIPEAMSLYKKFRFKTKSKLRNLYRFNQQANETTQLSQQNSTNGSSNEILEGWMQISSYEFDNSRRYPPISLPNNKQIYFHTNKDKFLINKVQRENLKKNDANRKIGDDDGLDFYFRMNKNQIYFSSSPEDINILGSIELDSLSHVDNLPDSTHGRFCFRVEDRLGAEYSICSSDKDSKAIRNRWYCKVAKSLLKEDPVCIEDKKAEFQAPRIEIEQKTYQPIILIPEPQKQCNENWNYNNKGSDWECICSEGREQSPIDLPSKDQAINSPAVPVFDFDQVEVVSDITSIDGFLMQKKNLKIKYDNGVLRVMNTYFGKIVTLDGAVYHIEEIVIHSGSEHTINGVRYPMELQLIGYGQSKGDIAKQIQMSFLFYKKAGVYNKFIEDLDFYNLPNRGDPEKDLKNNLFIPKIFFSTDSKELLTMRPYSLYTYQGSITFPPCTERTIHYVAAEPIPIGSTMITLLREAVRGDEQQLESDINYYRDTQPKNDRFVFYYDASNCKTPSYPAPRKLRPKGHYERIKKTVTEYFHVNDHAPSGLPDSYVISEQEARGNFIDNIKVNAK